MFKSGTVLKLSVVASFSSFHLHSWLKTIGQGVFFLLLWRMSLHFMIFISIIIQTGIEIVTQSRALAKLNGRSWI